MILLWIGFIYKNEFCNQINYKNKNIIDDNI